MCSIKYGEIVEEFLSPPESNLVATPMHLWEDYLTSKLIFDKLQGMFDCYQLPLDTDILMDTFGMRGLQYFECNMYKKGGKWTKPETAKINGNIFPYTKGDTILLCIGDYVNILWASGVTDLRFTTYAQNKYFYVTRK